jgi:hypothetical protein
MDYFEEGNLLIYDECMCLWDKMLDGGNNAISVCVIWLFLNLIPDSEEIHDLFLASKIYNKILDMAAKETVNKAFASNVATLLGNLYKQTGYEEYDNNMEEKSTALICKYLKLYNDGTFIFLDSLWALINLTYFLKNHGTFKIIVDSGVIEMLIGVMRKNMGDQKIKCALLKIIGNFSCSEKDIIISDLMRLNVLDVVAELLNDAFFAVRREACWIFANVAGSEDRVTFLIVKGYLDKIKQRLIDDDKTVVTEASRFIYNLSLSKYI